MSFETFNPANRNDQQIAITMLKNAQTVRALDLAFDSVEEMMKIPEGQRNILLAQIRIEKQIVANAGQNFYAQGQEKMFILANVYRNYLYYVSKIHLLLLTDNDSEILSQTINISNNIRSRISELSLKDPKDEAQLKSTYETVSQQIAMSSTEINKIAQG